GAKTIWDSVVFRVIVTLFWPVLAKVARLVGTAAGVQLAGLPKSPFAPFQVLSCAMAGAAASAVPRTAAAVAIERRRKKPDRFICWSPTFCGLDWGQKRHATSRRVQGGRRILRLKWIITPVHAAGDACVQVRDAKQRWH